MITASDNRSNKESSSRNTPERIACINMGGIGDNFLFAPVIQALKQAYPQSQLTFIVEQRSAAANTIIPGVDRTQSINFQQAGKGLPGKLKTFQQLRTQLTQSKFDLVVSSGSSPLIPILLASTGIPARVGYGTSPFTSWLLSHPATLNTKQYAANMYFSLAEAAFGRTQARQLLGVAKDTSIIPTLETQEQMPHWIEELLKETGSNKKRVLIHPGVSQISLQKGINKTWPATSWAKLIQELSANHHVILAGGPDDQQTINAIESALSKISPNSETPYSNVFGKTKNLSDLLQLAQQVNLAITVDSAPLHLSIGCQTPVVCLFGPTDPQKLIPQVDWVQPVTVSNLICQPCLWDVRQTSCETPICLDISVEQVLQKVDLLLNTP